MSLLGIDIGTSGCKAAAFNENGRCLAGSSREYFPLYPKDGWVELDATGVWSHVKNCISEIVSKTSADPVTALCVGSMGEAMVPVNNQREIAGHSILSSDIRGEQAVQDVKKQLSDEKFFSINPNVLSVNYTMPKLAWIRDNDPALYKAADKFMLWDGLPGYMMGCEPFVAFSSANRTLLFDVHREDWSDELCGICGIDKTKLPRCIHAGSIAGTVSKTFAAQTGLTPGVEIVAGGHDQCLNALGAGITAGGMAVDGIGTYECITPVFASMPDPATMFGLGLNIEHHVLESQFVTFLYNQGGSLLRWFKRVFANDTANETGVFDALNNEMPDTPTDLVVLPYFEPTGSPGYITNASGVIAGLTMATTRGEIYKAFLESITYYFAENLQNLEAAGAGIKEYVATGGGSRNDAFLQIKADITGAPYIRLTATECGLQGAAILAGLGTGVYRTAADAVGRFVKIEKRFEPELSRHEMYKEKLRRYSQLFPLLHSYLSNLRTDSLIKK